MRAPSLVALAGLATLACWRPPPPGDPGLFRFAVFGDGPYHLREAGRFRRVIEALNDRPLAFVIHVGDILWYPCADEAYVDRRAAMDRVRHPVIYTPGDNEWSDCIDPIAGGYDPLDRLASLRRVFFDPADRSRGAAPLALASQAADPSHAEFPEHARWIHRGVVFATLHVVGGANGRRAFAGRAAAHDDEVRRRTEAATAWLRQAFAVARDSAARAVVLAWHAETFLLESDAERRAFTPLHAALAEEAVAFAGPVLVVHGDNHEYTLDRPLRDPATDRPVANVQRLETFGSPDIGWVDVVVDTTVATLFRFEPHRTPRWMWW